MRKISSVFRLCCVISFVALFLMCGGITNVARGLLISDSDEITLGNNLKKQMLADTVNYPLYKRNQAVNRYIDSIGQILANAQKDRDTFPFTFTVNDKDSEVNAFSIPGGHVFIYTGLLKDASNGAQVAGVLAHEIGHITLYHGVDKLVQSQFIGFVNQIIFGADSNSIASAVTQLLEGLAFLHMSQGDEYQADSVAVVYTNLVGINPYGMKTFLGVLLQLYGGAGIFEPLSDHPDTKKRMDAVQRVINKTDATPTDSISKLFATEYMAIRNSI
jgi:beta-barrel assembly-enhancing protease